MKITKERLAQLACTRTVCKISQEEIIELAARVVSAEARAAELVDFLEHVKKCLDKNGEYAPISHEYIHKVLGYTPE